MLISSIAYAKYCDVVVCNRFENCFPKPPTINLENLKENSNLFLNGENLQKPGEILNKLIIQLNSLKCVSLIIFIANVEPVLNKNIIKKLIPYAKKIYLVNKHIEININDTIIYNLPIGLRDGEEDFKIHKHFSHKIIINEKMRNVGKNILCYLCFTISTHIGERLNCENILGNLSFVVNYNKENFPKQNSIHCGKVPVDLNYEMTHKSKYVLCPRGVGVATHRFYETLYLDSIPIVKRENNVFDKLYNAFPCLIVDSWEEVTEELLDMNYIYISKKLENFNNNFPNWYENVEVLLNVLDKT